PRAVAADASGGAGGRPSPVDAEEAENTALRQSVGSAIGAAAFAPAGAPTRAITPPPHAGAPAGANDSVSASCRSAARRERQRSAPCRSAGRRERQRLRPM